MCHLKGNCFEKQGTRNGTGTGTETGNGKREFASMKLQGQRRLATLGYRLHESQGQVGLTTHGKKELGGGNTTINWIIVRVKYPINFVVISQDSLHAAQDQLNPPPPLDGCHDRIG